MPATERDIFIAGTIALWLITLMVLYRSIADGLTLSHIANTIFAVVSAGVGTGLFYVLFMIGKEVDVDG